MDWQLPDIGIMITNNILPNSISAYAVHGACFKRLFQPNQTQKETTMQNYNYPEKHVSC